jgi:hypothetical protein
MNFFCALFQQRQSWIGDNESAYTTWVKEGRGEAAGRWVKDAERSRHVLLILWVSVVLHPALLNLVDEPLLANIDASWNWVNVLDINVYLWRSGGSNSSARAQSSRAFEKSR